MKTNAIKKSLILLVIIAMCGRVTPTDSWRAISESEDRKGENDMATKGMAVFTQNGEDFTINDPNIANEFSTSLSYTAGDRVYYQGTLYRFRTNHTAGAWNSSHVTAILLAEEFEEIEKDYNRIIDTLTEEIIKVGQDDFTECTNALPGTGTGTMRFAYRKTQTDCGRIKSVRFNSSKQQNTNVRFWIAKVSGSTLTLLETFVINVRNGDHTYANGIDFTTGINVPKDCVIGYQYLAGGDIGYYGGNEKSYSIGQTGTIGETYSYGSVYDYGISVSMECESNTAAGLKVAETFSQESIRFGQPTIEVCTNRLAQAQTFEHRFASKQSPANGGKIKKLIFKNAVNPEITIRFWIARPNGNGTITLLDTFVVIISSIKTEYINGVDFVYNEPVPGGCLIGFQTAGSSSIAYYGGNDGSYSFTGTAEKGGTYEAGENTYGVSIACEYENIVDYLDGKADKADEEIEELENKVDTLISSSVIRYGAKVPANTAVYLDSDIIHARVKYDASTDSEVRLIRSPAASTGYNVSRVDFVRFGEGIIGFYNACDYPAAQSFSIYKSYNPGFSFVEGHEYDIFSIRYLGYIYQLKITDAWTQETFTATELYAENTIGNGWGKRSVTAGEGVTIVTNDNYALQPEKNRICFIGDSYIEGNSIYQYKNSRFDALTFLKLKGGAFIWGQGGARSADGLGWLSTIMSLSDSDYYVLAFGMNDQNFDAWKTNMDSMISTVTTAGKKVILCTVPPVTSIYANDEHMLMNEYIRSLNYDYIDFAKLLSFNHDGITFDQSYFLSDGVHPTVESHQLMYNLIVSTLPQVFGTAIEE